MVMSDTLPLAEIKAHLSEIVDRVEREHDRVVLTRNGRPAAIIMSPADLEALEDTLELLSNPEALAEIKAARADAAEGRVLGAEELRGEVPSLVTAPGYRLVVTATAERTLARLPESVAAAIVEFMIGALVEAPRRVGHPLQRELAGLWAARRGPYRVVYEIDDEGLTVTVMRIDHRADIYRRR